MGNIITTLGSELGLVGLFFGLFLSYSIIPLLSDAAILIAAAVYNPITLFIITFISATLGSITSYYIGLKGIRFFVKKNMHPKNEKRARKFFRKWGPMSLLLLSWTPMLGDPLIIVAGTLKMGFWKFLLYTSISKVVYFVVLIWSGFTLHSLIF